MLGVKVTLLLIHWIGKEYVVQHKSVFPTLL